MPGMKNRLVVAILALVGVLVLAAVVAGTVGYYRFYRPFVRPLTFISGASLLEESIRNREPFRPPDSGEFTAQQWSRYREVESIVVAAVGPAIATYSEQRRLLMSDAATRGGTVEYRSVLRAMAEIGTVYLRAKAVQVNAMNRVGMSKAEFAWIQRQVLAASGLAQAELDIDGLRTAAQDRRDVIEVRTIAVDPTGQAANRGHIAASRTELESWSVLAFFDL